MYKIKVDKDDYSDPFNAGQMVGMITILMFIEKDGGIADAQLQRVKHACAEKLEPYFEIPSEDVLLMMDKSVKDIGVL